MNFTRAQVVRNWDRDGLEFIEDLSQRWGYEKIPDPVERESLAEYVERCARLGLCHIADDMHDQRAVRARLAAEEADLPIYQVLSPEEAAREAESEALEEAAAALRATDPTQRFATYRASRDELLREPAITFENAEEQP